MRSSHFKALALSAPITLTALASPMAAEQGDSEKAPPPRPIWVDANGIVKPDLAAHDVPMVGRDGKRLKDEKGSDKMVPSHIGEAPPPPLR
jgi:hypothetical protein